MLFRVTPATKESWIAALLDAGMALDESQQTHTKHVQDVIKELPLSVVMDVPSYRNVLRDYLTRNFALE